MRRRRDIIRMERGSNRRRRRRKRKKKKTRTDRIRRAEE